MHTLPHIPPQPANPTHKRCLSCGETLPLSAFYLKHGTSDARRAICRACAKLRRQERARAAEKRWHEDEGRQHCGSCDTWLPRESFSPAGLEMAAGRAVCDGCFVLGPADDLADWEGALAEESERSLTPEERERRIDLGLAIAHATCAPGQCRTLEELSAYTGITKEGVRQIERKALAKMHGRALEILHELGLMRMLKGGEE